MIKLFAVCLAIIAILAGVLNGWVPIVMSGVVLGVVAISGRLGQFTEQNYSGLVAFLTHHLKTGWLALAVISLIMSVGASWVSHQNPLSPVSGYLWLASLGALIVAGLLHDRTAPSTTSEIFTPPWKRIDWVLIVGVTLLAFALRLYQIDGMLPPFHGDEGEMGDAAWQVLHSQELPGGPRVPLFATMFGEHPTLFHYVQAAAMRVFGETDTGIRILSVIVGALCIPIVYLTARLYWNSLAAFTAGWLMAVSHLYIQYSRIALNNIESVWFVAALILLLGVIHKLNNPSRVFLPIITGLILGLAQYFYFGSQLLTVMAPILMVILWRQKRLSLTQAGVIGVVAIIAFLPMFVRFADYPQAFIDKSRGVFILSDAGIKHALGPEAAFPGSVPAVLWRQIDRTFGFLTHGAGDSSGFYWRDINGFDSVTDILIWTGLVIALAGARQYSHGSLVIWFGLGILLAGILTNEAPYGPRLIVVLTSAFLIAGLVFQQLDSFAGRFGNPVLRRVPLGIAASIALATLYLNVNTYFVQYRIHGTSPDRISIAREMAANADQYDFYLVGLPDISVEYGTFRFVARRAQRYDAASIDELPTEPISGDGRRGLWVILIPGFGDTVEDLTTRYPDGITEEHFDLSERLMYTVYRIPPRVP